LLFFSFFLVMRAYSMGGVFFWEEERCGDLRDWGVGSDGDVFELEYIGVAATVCPFDRVRPC
jgi:hypothetical protein